jgi:hypothetical protein
MIFYPTCILPSVGIPHFFVCVGMPQYTISFSSTFSVPFGQHIWATRILALYTLVNISVTSHQHVDEMLPLSFGRILEGKWMILGEEDHGSLL